MKKLLAGALAFLVSAADAHQLPFIATPPTRDPPIRTFELRQAVHLSLTNRSIPALSKIYSHADRIQAADLSGYSASGHSLKTKRTKAWRPTDAGAFQAARRASYHGQRALREGKALSASELFDAKWAADLEWEEEEIEVPDTSDLTTLAALAKMTANAYSLPDGVDWYDLDGKYNVTESFGWLEDGVRGHVFADETNSTIVVSIKVLHSLRTSPYYVGGKSPTKKRDTTNDNLFFSCCCARVDWTWTPVCDCYSGTYTCQQNCIEEAVMTESAYYPIATDLYNNITALYPDAQIWIVGHSLGGALGALLAHTFGVPGVAFEAPGDHLPATRLHLPLPPGGSLKGSSLVTHVYHNGDPIPMGTCTGRTSVCEIASLALESRCHTGTTILYDTVGVLGTTVDARWHRISWVIENLLIEDWDLPAKKSKRLASAAEDGRKIKGWGWWPGGGGKTEDDEDPPEPPVSRGIPRPEPETDCSDCFRWDYD